MLLACSPTKVSIDELSLKESRYFYLHSKQPYTGEAISKFDNGKISSMIKFKNGVPDGKWFAYGYKGEIIQEGYYHSIDISNEDKFKGEAFLRLNICTTKEGPVEFTDIILVSKKRENITVENKNKLRDFLKSKSINIKGDSINEIRYTKGELEN